MTRATTAMKEQPQTSAEIERDLVRTTALLEKARADLPAASARMTTARDEHRKMLAEADATPAQLAASRRRLDDAARVHEEAAQRVDALAEKLKALGEQIAVARQTEQRDALHKLESEREAMYRAIEPKLQALAADLGELAAKELAIYAAKADLNIGPGLTPNQRMLNVLQRAFHHLAPGVGRPTRAFAPGDAC